MKAAFVSFYFPVKKKECMFTFIVEMVKQNSGSSQKSKLRKTTGFQTNNCLKSRELSEITKMNSSAHGINTSGTEVTHVSSHGIWLLSSGQEHFLSYEDFPWFKEAPIGKVLNIEEVSPGHFHWPDLDIDLGLDTIEHPEKYPLKSK